jgi:hypothetical protein
MRRLSTIEIFTFSFAVITWRIERLERREQA